MKFRRCESCKRLVEVAHGEWRCDHCVSPAASSGATPRTTRAWARAKFKFLVPMAEGATIDDVFDRVCDALRDLSPETIEAIVGWDWGENPMTGGEIVFEEDGTATAIYSDGLAEYLRDLSPDGTIVVRRASSVEFDSDLQGWVVFVNGSVGERGVLCAEKKTPGINQPGGCCAHPTREAALAAEVAYLEGVLL